MSKNKQHKSQNTSYQEVFTEKDELGESLIKKPPSAEEVSEVVDFFKTFGEKAVASGSFNLEEFKTNAEKVFEKCGYRQNFPGGGGWNTHSLRRRHRRFYKSRPSPKRNQTYL